MLESYRRHAPNATFIFMSTNKVYGDNPNSLPLKEEASRWSVAEQHPWAARGIPESMSIDSTIHSVFGASKAAADLLVQEYGGAYGLSTACFRAGTITGPAHAAVELHGFLAYLLHCATHDKPYTIYGYKGKQVRDILHADDLARAFESFWRNPKSGAVYNIGGGPYANCSVIEAIQLIWETTGYNLCWNYHQNNRRGDHIWWISSIDKFIRDYPGWRPTFDVRSLIADIMSSRH